MKRYTLHPACKLFPPLAKADLASLAEDIKINGLQNPITLLENRILDGRNRYKACRLAKVEPQFIEWSGDGSPVEWALSQNLFRRHLTSSQRAVLAHDLLPVLEKEAKERQRQSKGRGKKKVNNNLSTLNGTSAETAARLTKTNHSYVASIKNLSKKAPDLIDSIRQGIITIQHAIKLSGLTAGERKKIVSQLDETPTAGRLNELIKKSNRQKREKSARQANNTKTRKQIIHGDCLEIMPTMKSKSIDVCCTSPPYNFNVPYTKYKDKIPRDEYLDWMKDVLIQIKRLLKPQGSLFLNIGHCCTDPWLAMDVAQVARQLFQLQNNICWVKSITIDNVTRGNYNPLITDRYIHKNWEHIFHFTKNGKVKIDKMAIGVPSPSYSNQARWGDDIHCRGNAWFMQYETVQKEKEHPATFPIELPLNCIKLHGIKKNMVVLDPFAGIGTTLEACTKLGVQGIGIEIDENYI